MAQKIPWEILFKCFQNQATQEELSEINSWLNESPEHIGILEEIHSVYSLTYGKNSLFEPDTLKAWNSINNRITTRETGAKYRLKMYRYVAGIAAILLVGIMLVGVVSSYFQRIEKSRQFTEVVTLAGQKTSVILPDGSTVWLNSSSSIKYSSNFNTKDREIIMKGEAFFDVTKNKAKTFRVKSNALCIEVHGTSFNVKNNAEGKIQEITVAEGVVGVINNSSEICRLTKGEQVSYDVGTQKAAITRVNPELITAWKNNELIFRDTPIKDVITLLESWYGVNITVDSKMIGEHNYTLHVKTESFREVLDMMKLVTPFTYTINGKDITLKYNN